jgi:hypothetical protein
MAFIGEDGARVVINDNLAIVPAVSPLVGRKGTVVKQLGMLCTVKWDDGKTIEDLAPVSEINAYYLDIIPPSI